MNWKTSVLIKELMKFTDFSYLDKGDDFLSKVFCSPRNENMNFLVRIKFLKTHNLRTGYVGRQLIFFFLKHTENSIKSNAFLNPNTTFWVCLNSMCQSGKGQPKISNERSGPKNLS
jgi:hypothetical protein